MTSRKHPSTAFWVTVVMICLPVMYVLSIGPVSWIAYWAFIKWDWWPDSAQSAFDSFYAPLIWLMDYMPNSVGVALNWYAVLAVPH